MAFKLGISWLPTGVMPWQRQFSIKIPTKKGNKVSVPFLPLVGKGLRHDNPAIILCIKNTYTHISFNFNNSISLF